MGPRSTGSTPPLSSALHSPDRRPHGTPQVPDHRCQRPPGPGSASDRPTASPAAPPPRLRRPAIPRPIMEAAASGPAAAGSKRTPEQVVVHPLVLLSVVDHYNRVAKDSKKRVVGVLLGESYKGRVDATNSFAGGCGGSGPLDAGCCGARMCWCAGVPTRTPACGMWRALGHARAGTAARRRSTGRRSVGHPLRRHAPPHAGSHAAAAPVLYPSVRGGPAPCKPSQRA